jgi:protein-tyrosine-phosphatase
MNKLRVLSLYTGNSARSQLAEGFLRKYAGDIFETHSAVLELSGVNPPLVSVFFPLKENGAVYPLRSFPKYASEL